MGLVNDLKKIFFGAEALTKSAMEKGKDAAASTVENLSEEITSKTSGLKDAVIEKAGDAMDTVQNTDILGKASETMNDISKTVTQKASETFEQLKENESLKNASKSLEDLAGKAGEKVGDLSETIGTTVFGENNERLDQLKDLSEDIGGKVLDAKEKIVDKAKELKVDLDEKIDETIEKAKDLEAKEAFEKTQRQNTPPTDHGDSLLDDTDDFFSKAEKYADGDYSVFSEGKITLDKETSITTSDVPKKNVKAAGFEDLDGDGNEIVDDAIIDNSDADV